MQMTCKNLDDKSFTHGMVDFLNTFEDLNVLRKEKSNPQTPIEEKSGNDIYDFLVTNLYPKNIWSVIFVRILLR